MLSFIGNIMGRKAKQIMAKREPDFIIGSKEEPYMRRWWAIPRNRFFNIYIHEIIRDDDDRALHDHPWPSLSYCVEGGVFETYAKYIGEGVTRRRSDILRWIGQGKWIYRSPNFAHRLELPENISGRSTITIFMTGPRIREWGFLCPKGWRHWKDFVSQENKGEQGIGCGEVEDFDVNNQLNIFHCRRCGESDLKIYDRDSYCRNCDPSENRIQERRGGVIIILLGIIFIEIVIVVWLILRYML